MNTHHPWLAKPLHQAAALARWAPFALFALFALLALASAPALASGNLLVNSGAEAGPASAIGEQVVTVPGWTLDGNFTVVTYNPDFGGPSTSSPGPAGRGLNYFAGGPGNGLSSASQTLDLSSYQSWFASHALAFTLSGWLGGFESQNDNAVLSVRFLDAQGNELEFASTNSISAGDRNNVTGLLFLSTGFADSANVHLSPVQAVVTLTMTRTDGSYNDGYADNLSFTIDDGVPAAVPEPGTTALWLAGLAGVGWCARRRGAEHG